MASRDDDLVAAIDFYPGEHPELLRQEMQKLVATVHGDQANGLSLSESFTLHMEKNSVGYHQQQDDGVDYNGSIQIVGDSLVIVVPASEIGATDFWEGFWKKLVVGAAVTATLVASGALCLVLFPAGPFAGPVCGAVAGGLSGGVGELVSAALDHKPIDSEVWGGVVATAIFGAVAGGLGVHFMQLTAASTTTLIANTQATLRTWASKLGAWGNPLGALANLLTEHVANIIHATVQRLARGRLGASNVGLRVMALGDSITYGTASSNGSGYRSALYGHLTQHGGSVEFVGSQHSGPAPAASEGHPGWLIGDIAGIVDSALATYRPDVVLLHIGTNDMSNNVDPRGAPARLDSLIDQILRYDPDVTVLVSTIVPAAFPETAARIATYNAAIPGVVEARRAAGQHVWLVDMDAVTTANLADGLHPNDRGYQKMAGAFYDGLVTVAQAGWIEGPDSGGTPAGGPVKGWSSQGTIASGTFSAGAGAAVYADINGDGRTDYLQVNDNSSVKAWINGGPNPKDPADARSEWLWWPQGTIANGVGATGSSIRFADINGDGRTDYLQVNDNSSVKAWINGGPNPK
ncbi:GDSL-type esterase/lipase family protein, partial [Streptomyces sp. NPDC058739]|uniref:GDSL-type esterase/lipase family protein n=1 Tax=Streptomyces sp. NPDC058739 TaxID=3346618 RepID=UPI0036C1A600